MKKIATGLMLVGLFFVCIQIVSAKGFKMRGGVRTAVSAAHLVSIKNWSKSDYTDYCEPKPAEGQFLCDDSSADKVTKISESVSIKEGILNRTTVDEYSEYSVDSYNAKVSELNSLVDEHNTVLRKDCADLYKLCNEYLASDTVKTDENTADTPGWMLLLGAVLILGTWALVNRFAK